jgi:hypothetical protein
MAYIGMHEGSNNSSGGTWCKHFILCDLKAAAASTNSSDTDASALSYSYVSEHRAAHRQLDALQSSNGKCCYSCFC